MNRRPALGRTPALALALVAARAVAPSCADAAGAFRRIIGEFQARQENVGLAGGVQP